MISRVRLSARYVRNRYFVFTVLGKYSKRNTREVVISGEHHTVNSVKLCIMGNEDALFNLKFSKNAAIFVSSATGEYKLPLTTSQHLLTRESCDGLESYITVSSSRSSKDFDVVYVPLIPA